MPLTLIANPNPPLRTQPWSSDTRLVVKDDVVVDDHYSRVLALADHLREEHARKEAEQPTRDRCPLLDVPEGYSEDEIGAAIRILDEAKFEYFPARLNGPTTAMYLRDNRAAESFTGDTHH